MRDEYVCCQVAKSLKKDYLALVGKFTYQLFEEEFQEKMDVLDSTLTLLGFGPQTYIKSYLGLAKYAINGDYSHLLYMYTLSQSAETSVELWLFDESGTLIGMHELLGAFEEFTSGPYQSPGLMLLMNMLRPRVAIDLARLGETEPDDISLIELALLAGLKERTLRNYAVQGHTHFLKTFTENDGVVMVRAKDAYPWLEGRKGYVCSDLPDSKKLKQDLISCLQSYYI